MKLSKQVISRHNGIFLIKSNEDILVQEFISNVRKSCPDHDIIVCDIERWCDALISNNIFEDAKKSVYILPELQKDHVSGIKEALKNHVYEEDIFIIVESTTIPHTKPYTELKALCGYADLKAPAVKQIEPWIKEELESYQLDYSFDVPRYIIERLGSDIGILKNEIKKLSLLYPKGKVTKEICAQTLSMGLTVKYFDFVELFFKRKMAEVLEILKIIPEAEYPRLLSLLQSQAEKIYRVIEYRELGMSKEDMAALIGVPKFILTAKFFIYTGYFKKVRILKLMETLNSANVALRSSKFDKKLCFRSYLIRSLSA